MNIVYAFLICFLASISTSIGSLLIYLKSNPKKLLVFSLAFSGTIMLTISLFDLIIESYNILKYERMINIILILLLFNIGFIFSKFINSQIKISDTIYRIGIFSMIIVIIHNILEGVITFLTSVYDLKLGISLAIGIAFHNIPEGICIAIPIYYGSKNKKKALLYPLISGFTELLGGVIGFIFIKNKLSYFLLPFFYSIVAGIMVYIGYFELLHKSFNLKQKNTFWQAVFLGFLLMMSIHFCLN